MRGYLGRHTMEVTTTTRTSHLVEKYAVGIGSVDLPDPCLLKSDMSSSPNISRQEFELGVLAW